MSMDSGRVRRGARLDCIVLARITSARSGSRLGGRPDRAFSPGVRCGVRCSQRDAGLRGVLGRVRLLRRLCAPCVGRARALHMPPRGAAPACPVEVSAGRCRRPAGTSSYKFAWVVTDDPASVAGHADCRGVHGVFFADDPTGAKKLCERCPVIDQCREYCARPTAAGSGGRVGRPD